MEDFYKIFLFLAISSVIVLFLIMWAGPLIDMSSRVEKLESYHTNICPECGQILHD